MSYFANGGIVEFAMPQFYLDGPNIDAGDAVYLRMSQSFGYSAAGGPTFGSTSLAGVISAAARSSAACRSRPGA